MRKLLLTLAAHCIVVLLSMPVWGAQPLFDSHLHFDTEHGEHYPAAKIIEILRVNDIRQAVVTSRPPGQARVLHALAPDLIIPILGVYRLPADKQTWMQDSVLVQRLTEAIRQGGWRGVGELHLFAADRQSPVFLSIVDLAADNGLPLLMHCDPVVIDALFTHRPDARVIWAHAGAYPYPPLLRDYVERYPSLWMDLSVRDDRIAPGGELDATWEDLLMEHSERFMVGVDTYRHERWGEYG